MKLDYVNIYVNIYVWWNWIMLTYVNMGDIHTDIHTDRVTNLGKFYSCSMQLKNTKSSEDEGEWWGELKSALQQMLTNIR